MTPASLVRRISSTCRWIVADRRLVIGFGNAMRRDDGVGPWIATRLADGGLRARVWSADGMGLIWIFGTETNLTLIDATRSGSAPGSIVRFDAIKTSLPRPLFHNSTHEFGLAEAVETARRLGRLPDRLEVIGIEGADFTARAGLSAEVARAASAVVAELTQAVR
ncbi:hydrogenase maturation protease [Aliiruegeria haliotis]|uniref:Hydrogenase maturation protease n=1 Tax=Aliiruegeria haliotis TaxID=1280846 RepID=A0A2T0S0E6_9RHOB|nr:hydrogenase maturation protease [Aliiruegeria haliotis]PRY26885.1 hydrogenase maturation protease [Aliiruegeria haliotis]